MSTHLQAPGRTFADVARISHARCLHWHPGGLEEWSVSDWAVAMAGEAGEVCDAVKKLRRIEMNIASSNNPADREAAIAAIGKEIGDTYIYLDLLAQRLGLDIETCIRRTFNRVSVRENLPYFIAAPEGEGANREIKSSPAHPPLGADGAPPSPACASAGDGSGACRGSIAARRRPLTVGGRVMHMDGQKQGRVTEIDGNEVLVAWEHGPNYWTPAGFLQAMPEERLAP